uniref:GAG-pre-integrase domain-containing protein n=1 Tax=Peronospora matthiolae TaxID=2874970 RepID=A0AAV1UUW5_9STRA
MQRNSTQARGRDSSFRISTKDGVRKDHQRPAATVAWSDTTPEIFAPDEGQGSISSAKSDAKLNVIGHGTLKLRVWTGHALIDARLENTLHIQDLFKKPRLLTAAAARGMAVKITRNECVAKLGGTPVCHISEDETELWHGKLGHASYVTLNAMVKGGRNKGVAMKSDVACDVCATSKQVRK